MQRFLTLLLLLIASVISNAQNCFWAKGIGGPNDENSNAIVLDNARNVYTAGFYRGAVDFDPGAGISMLNSGWYVSYINKLDSMGDFIWAKAIGTPVGTGGWSAAQSMAIDASANLYVSGFFQDTCDFDPSAGVTYFIAGTATQIYSAYVCKYDSAGNLIWAQAFGGPSGLAMPVKMTLDALGNTYVTGSFRGTVDFDPGIGTQNATAASGGTGDDIFISKFDAAGNFKWVATMGSNGSDDSWGIQTDVRGNVYTVGRFENTVDFDPGPSVANLISTGGRDIFICKLDSSGNYQWAKSMGNSTHDDGGFAIVIDHQSNLCLGGNFGGTVDFDPGSAVHNLTSNGQADAFTAKFDTAGNYLWAKAFLSPSDVNILSIATDDNDNVYSAGYYYLTADFDPGAGTHNITSVGSADIFVSKLDPSGNFVSTQSMGGPNSDIANSIAINQNEDMFTTGVFNDSADFDPSTAVYSLIGNGGPDIFISKINNPLNAIISAVAPATCYGASNGSATVTATGGSQPYTYSWSTTPTQTNSIASGLSSGPVSVTVTESYGCTFTASATVTQPPLDSAKICMVTVDATSRFNIIIWDKSAFTDVDSFIVYREISTNNYMPIGVVAFDSLSQFIDTVATRYAPNTGDPNTGTYRYKIQTKNACGVSSPFSPYHNTIYFLHSGSTFFWTQLYTIQNAANPVTSYDLMRDDNSTGNWQVVTSVAGTQQTVTDPLYSIYQNTASWRVQTSWSISCTPTLRSANSSSVSSNYSTSVSNIIGNTGIGVQTHSTTNNFNVFPTVSEGRFTIVASVHSLVEVRSMLGEVVFSSFLSEDRTEINLSHLAKGSYFVHLYNEHGSAVRKVIIE
jgi:hypothetical protein